MIPWDSFPGAWQHFTETPDPAFVGWKAGTAALAPEISECDGVYSGWVPIGIYDLQQISASGAAEILFRFLAHGAAANASQLRRLNGIGLAWAAVGRPD
jgi:hypothetical protein